MAIAWSCAIGTQVSEIAVIRLCVLTPHRRWCRRHNPRCGRFPINQRIRTAPLIGCASEARKRMRKQRYMATSTSIVRCPLADAYSRRRSGPESGDAGRRGVKQSVRCPDDIRPEATSCLGLLRRCRQNPRLAPTYVRPQLYSRRRRAS